MIRLPRPPAGLPPDVAAWAQDLVETLQRAIDVLTRDMQRRSDPVELPSVAMTNLTRPPFRFRAGQGARMVFVVDEVGGPVPVYSDGRVWRRVTDGAEVRGAG